MKPFVSVVVPNYNHARFLRRRLGCIYEQNFRDFEILLLDDASDDGSLEILKGYAKENPANTQLIVNERNSKSPFAQWAKGIEAARGELVWIAESDDYCGRDFLQKMMAPFRDEKVVLSFTAPQYVDALGKPTPYQYEQYTEALSREKWQQSYCVPAENEIVEGLGIRNTVPNVSAALFRRKAALPHLTDPTWRSMRILGDWCFYLRLIRGGKVAFVKNVDASFTHTPNNTSAEGARTRRLLFEHAYLIGTLCLMYPDLPQSVLATNYAFIAAHCRWLASGGLPDIASEWHGATIGERDSLATALDQTRGELENAYASLSWKLTSPLRMVDSILRKLNVRSLS
jgi:glycosyltransferase involved in cell wall biosynthesis